MRLSVSLFVIVRAHVADMSRGYAALHRRVHKALDPVRLLTCPSVRLFVHALEEPVLVPAFDHEQSSFHTARKGRTGVVEHRDLKDG